MTSRDVTRHVTLIETSLRERSNVLPGSYFVLHISRQFEKDLVLCSPKSLLPVEIGIYFPAAKSQRNLLSRATRPILFILTFGSGRVLRMINSTT